jgi:hypothetical protein
MSGLFKNFGFASSTASEGVRLAVASSAQVSMSRGRASGGLSTVVNFPKRPDLTILSETIPLFYIAKNTHGFWVAREAEGRSGGEFLLRRSAVRFARHKSAPAGCAMMFLNEALELDIENEGSRLVGPLAVAIDIVTRRAPTSAALVAMAVAEWRKLVAQVSRAFAGERRNRAAIERELFHGQNILPSKSDDDLPVL